jgi:hypothetical protein
MQLKPRKQKHFNFDSAFAKNPAFVSSKGAKVKIENVSGLQVIHQCKLLLK